MGYDEQSQMPESEDACVAKANAPAQKTFEGVLEYLELGVDKRKLVLGVPWYGYVYPCVEKPAGDGDCRIKSVPFRGSDCSDAAGKEFAFGDVQDMLKTSLAGRRWDENSLTPYFDAVKQDGPVRVYYDDAVSLGLKYTLAQQLGLGGVGMWTANFLDYSNSTQIHQMWSALP